MGQQRPAKANRLGVWIKREKDPEPRMAAEFDSKWFSNFKDFSSFLEQDSKIREIIKLKYGRKAGISSVKINRKPDQTEVTIASIKPANIFGRDNQKLEELRSAFQEFVPTAIKINVVEASYTHPNIIAEKIALDLERRVAFRKACKTSLAKAMSNQDVLGMTVCVSGRLSGADIARTEWYREGKVPLHTLHANIENGFAKAETTYGIIGVKVIINKTIPTASGNSNNTQAPSRGRHRETVATPTN